MRDGTLLVNTARGSVLDEEALADELISGRICAVLCVFTIEPLPLESRLRNLNNVILLPHMGGQVKDLYSNISTALVLCPCVAHYILSGDMT